MKHRSGLIFNFLVMLSMLTGLMTSPALAAAAAGPQPAVQAQTGLTPTVGTPVMPLDNSGMPPAPAFQPSEDKTAEPLERFTGKSLVKDYPGASESSVDPLVQSTHGPGDMPSPLTNWEGISSAGVGAGVYPPDTDGDVGPNHYLQIVNHGTFGSWIRVWDKTGAQLYDFGMTNLWPAGDPCNTMGYGDPIALYDQLADRWLITQFAFADSFAPPYYECIAVSKTPVPTNVPADWWVYTMITSNTKLNDYPKLGVWPDAYYMTANLFLAPNFTWAGTGMWALDRANMLTGGPLNWVYFELPITDWGGMLPADLDGSTLPAPGTPNYMIELHASEWPNVPPFTQDEVALYEFHVDWATPANSTFTNVATLAMTPFDGELCVNPWTRSCIPQPGTGQGLDAIGDRGMFRLAYRNFGGYETMVSNLSVDTNGANHAGIRWFELRKSGGNWAIQQEGTYSPDSEHRWMGSVAMDHVGNIALGYSVSSSTVFPSVRYAGRLSSDPAGTLPQAEELIVAGTGVQTGSGARWGDYSAMAVDPVDDCTFWYTQEYMGNTSAASWQTRVASFKFPNCTIGGTGHLQGTVTDAATTNPIAGAAIDATMSVTQTYGTTTGPDGTYGMDIPAATYDVTASAFGYAPATVLGVQLTVGMTETVDFALAPAALYTVSGYVTDSNTGWPLYAEITINGYPGPSVWTDPVTGFYSIDLPEGVVYTFDVAAWVPGYTPASRDVGPLTGNQVEDFALDADMAACTAPGYHFQYDWSENFEASDGGFTVSGASTTWQWGAPTSGPNAAHSGVNVWATNLAGNYNNSENGYITSPVIDLSSFAGATFILEWFQWARTEASYDYISVEATSNGGATWNVVYGPLSGVIDTSWAKKQAILSSAYAVPNFQFRLHFTSDSSVVYPGWYVDDLGISAQYPPPPTVVYSEDFNAADGGYTHAGVQDEWQWGVPTTVFPGGCNGGSAGCWDTDLIGNYNNSSNYALNSPLLDLTGVVLPPGSNLFLKWAQAIHIESATWDHAYGEASINGGAYSTLWSHTGSTRTEQWNVKGPFDVSSAAGGTLQLQYRLTSDSSVNYEGWSVDDVEVYYAAPWTPSVPCVVDPGGLVVGNTYDANTQDALDGVQVENEDGGVTFSVPTPGDPAVDDGFYTLFSPDGPKVHTASYVAGYVPDVQTVSVPLFDTVEQDFFLQAGWLQVTPPSLNQDLELGATATQTLVLENLGGPPVNWQVVEVDGGFVPGRSPESTQPRLPVQATPVESSPAITIGELSFSANPAAASAPARATPLRQPTAPNAVTITHSLDQSIISGNSVSCNNGVGHTNNSYMRVFNLADFGINSAFAVTNVEIGIEQATGAGGSQPATVNLYTLSGPLLWANLTLIGSAPVTVSDQQLTIINMPVNGVAPAGSQLVVEFFTPDGQTAGNLLFVGSNNLGQTSPTYLAAADCGAVEPTDTAALGFPGMHLVMNVTGEPGGTLDTVPWLSETPISGTLAGNLPPLGYQPEAAVPAEAVAGAAQETVGAEAPSASGEPSALGLVSQPFTPEAVIYDNGPLVTHPGGGAGGADASAVQTALLMSVYGFGHALSSGFRVADDFTITDPAGWNIDQITFFAYQTNSGTTSTIDHVNLRIWDGVPGAAGSNVVFGDTTTNRLTNTVWSNDYRVLDTALTNTARPVMANTAAVGTVLPAGTYWLDWQTGGTLASGPWAPPVSILGQINTGDGWQYDPSTTLWTPLIDTGSAAPQGLPFIIEGTLGSGPTQDVVVTFDASVVGQPGQYLADLVFQNDTPYGDVTVPVVMNVTAPATYGKLEGTVTGLGYCDVNPAPLEGAEVIVTDSGGMTYTLTTDAAGYYSYWFDQSVSPVDITVNAAEHTQGSATGVVITGGATTVQDFDLRWLEPCMSVVPDNLEVTLATGYTARETLDLNNLGAAPSDFEILEKQGGFTPVVLGKALKHRGDPQADGYRFVHELLSPVAIGDELYRVDATASTGHVCILGVEWALGSYWVTSGGQASCSSGVDNYLFELAPDGSVLNSWNQNTSSTFGWRDLAFDGTYLYASDSGTVVQIDPATGATTGVTITSPQNPARALAYDPETDHFWTANFSSSIYEFDRSGNVINTFPNSLAVYGAAWDMYSEGGPYLWVWSQDGSPAVLATQLDPLTGNQTGNAFIGSSTDGTDIAGGATIINGDHPDYPGMLIFAGAHQAGQDMIVGYDLAATVAMDVPWLTEAPITGTVPADDFVTIDVTFDSMTYTLGTYTATLRIKTQDPVTANLDVPVTMHIVPIEYGVAAALVDDSLSGKNGTTVTYSLVVTNTSNGPVDAFDIAVSGNTWNTTAPATVGPLDPGESVTVDVTVDIPATAMNGDQDVAEITVTSQTDPTKSAQVTATTTADVNYAVELVPAADAKSDLPGAAVVYTLTLTNTSDITLTFEASAANVWDTQLSETDFVLGVGESAVFTVQVTIPADAADGDFDVATITVASVEVPTLTAESELTTTAVLPPETGFWVYLPLVMNGFTVP